MSAEPSRRLRSRVARRIGRFLGVTDLSATTDRLAREVDGVRAELDAQRDRLAAVEASAAARPLGASDGSPAPDRRGRRRRRVRPSAFQALWVGPRLSVLEQLSLTSFVQNGHDVRLYVYEEPVGVPDGVTCLDAREILPEDRIFVHGPEGGFAEGSPIAFSDYFRFKLLHDRGGWWFDVDVVCLRPVDLDAPYCFAWEQEGIVGSSILRAPQGSPFTRELYERAHDRIAEGTGITFAEIGPHLITRIVTEQGLERYVRPANTFFPVHWQHALDMFRPDDVGAWWTRFEGPYAVHFWNETLRWRAIDKDATYPATSPFERLKRRYGIAAPPGAPVVTLPIAET